MSGKSRLGRGAVSRKPPKNLVGGVQMSHLASSTLGRALQKLKANPSGFYRSLILHPNPDVMYLGLKSDETQELYEYLRDVSPAELRKQGIVFSRTNERRQLDQYPLYSKGGGFPFVWFNDGELPINAKDGSILQATDFFRGTRIVEDGHTHLKMSHARPETPESPNAVAGNKVLSDEKEKTSDELMNDLTRQWQQMALDNGKLDGKASNPTLVTPDKGAQAPSEQTYTVTELQSELSSLKKNISERQNVEDMPLEEALKEATSLGELLKNYVTQWLNLDIGAIAKNCPKLLELNQALMVTDYFNRELNSVFRNRKDKSPEEAKKRDKTTSHLEKNQYRSAVQIDTLLNNKFGYNFTTPLVRLRSLVAAFGNTAKSVLLLLNSDGLTAGAAKVREDKAALAKLYSDKILPAILEYSNDRRKAVAALADNHNPVTMLSNPKLGDGAANTLVTIMRAFFILPDPPADCINPNAPTSVSFSGKHAEAVKKSTETFFKDNTIHSNMDVKNPTKVDGKELPR